MKQEYRESVWDQLRNKAFAYKTFAYELLSKAITEKLFSCLVTAYVKCFLNVIGNKTKKKKKNTCC